MVKEAVAMSVVGVNTDQIEKAKHNRPVGAGFTGTGCMCKEVGEQRSRVYLRVKLYNRVFYYPWRKRIAFCDCFTL
jgi:hypothetical protein